MRRKIGYSIKPLLCRRTLGTMKLPLSLLFLLPAFPLMAQGTFADEQAAHDAVRRILRHSGLLPNFIVRADPGVKTAIAFIKDRQRVIEYDPAFIARIVDSVQTDRAAVSILAHEIAHHLLGHTLDPSAMHPGDELACDRYSGFILCSMGATLEESLAAMEVAGDPHGTRRHPPRSARLEAIRQGWEEARCLAQGIDEEPFTIKDGLRFTVIFIGDANTYYVDSADRVLWYDRYAEPIEFGVLRSLATGDFLFAMNWGEETFHVDRHNAIWRKTEHGAPLKVGRMEPFMSK